MRFIAYATNFASFFIEKLKYSGFDRDANSQHHRTGGSVDCSYEGTPVILAKCYQYLIRS